MCSRDVEDYLSFYSIALDNGAGRRGGALLREMPDRGQEFTAHLRAELAHAGAVETDLDYRARTACQLLNDLMQADVCPALALGSQERRKRIKVFLLAGHLDRVAGRQQPAIATGRQVGRDKHVRFGQV
jgi:hypothetical protein